jgi:aryl-alcohol dehydrogenase-like predicted oxidoreductase
MSDNTNDRGLSRKHIVESVEKSLTRIGIDYIDIYFCHRPDPDTPIEETLRAMDDLVHQGKILYWGTSEWSGAQLREVCELADRRNLYRPQVEQPQYNLFDRGRFENDLLPAVQEWGLGTVVWSPLASGLLTGKYDEGVPPESRLAGIDWLKKKLMTEENLDAVRRMSPIAERLGCSRAQLALAWARRQPGVSSVITGATSLAQLEENLGSLAVNLDEEGGRALDEIFPPVQGFAQK